MALFKPYKITSDKLEDLAIKEGQLIVTTDTKKLYVDVSATERIEVTSDAEVDLSDYVTTSILTSTIGEEASARQKQDQLLEQAIDDKVGADDIIAGNNIQVNHDGVSGHITISATDTNTNTTYTLSKSGSTITLSGSDGSSTSVTDADTTYSLGSFGVTASAAELNKLDGVTATATELNYVDGVTSNIQTQLNGKAASNHTHSYLPLSGGTLTGTLNSRAIAPTATNTYSLGTSSLKYNAVYATTFYGSLSGNASSATKLGSSTVGSSVKPIYLNKGAAVASSSTVGSATRPVYLNDGAITQGTYTLGAACAKGVDTSISTGSTSTNLPTSKAVAALVASSGGGQEIAIQSTEPTDSNIKLWIKI